MRATWSGDQDGPVGGILAVLFTADRRVFFEFEDHTIRVAVEWERDEALLQMLSWRDSVAKRVTSASRRRTLPRSADLAR